MLDCRCQYQNLFSTGVIKNTRPVSYDNDNDNNNRPNLALV